MKLFLQQHLKLSKMNIVEPRYAFLYKRKYVTTDGIYDSHCMVTVCARTSSIPEILLLHLKHVFTEHTSKFLSL